MFLQPNKANVRQSNVGKNDDAASSTTPFSNFGLMQK